MRIKNLLNNLINLLLAAFMSLDLVYASATSLYIPYPPKVIFAFVSILLIVYSIIFLNKLSMRTSEITLGALIAATAASVMYKGYLLDLAYNFYIFMLWAYKYFIGGGVHNPEYEMYLIFILCTMITLLVFIFTIKKFNFYVLLISGTALYASEQVFDFNKSYPAFYLFLFLIIVYYFRHIHLTNSLKRSNEYLSPLAFTLWSLPLCVVIFGSSLLIPYDSHPIKWQWLDDAISTISSTSLDSSHKFEYFSVSSTGFGSNANALGGKVQADKTLVLKVNSPRPVYLRGATSDFYSGTAWINTDTVKMPLLNDNYNYKLSDFDLTEAIKGMELLTRKSDNLAKYFYNDKIKVEYQKVRTKSLFLPVKPESINFNSSNFINIFFKQDGILSSERLLNQNFSYTVNAYDVKYDDNSFKNALRKSRKGLYQLYASQGGVQINTGNFSTVSTFDSGSQSGSNVMKNFSLVVKPVFDIITKDDLEMLSRYSDSAYAKYLQLPDELPQRVVNLAYQITSKSKNNYDSVKTIEQYLSSTYPYSLSPDPTPDGRDFVDYFLFDGKKGYCTYYASAMTVLVRSLGIPARYVEGYILPRSTKSANTYEVTNEQAHAWVEVYFEGFGWLTFEPTSSFSESLYNSSSPTSAASGRPSSSIPTSAEEFMNGHRSSSDSGVDISTTDDETEKSNHKIYYTILIIAIFVVLIGCIISFNFIRRKIRIRKLKKMQPKESVLGLYKYYVKILTLQRLNLRPGETPHQYSDRVDIYFLFRPVSFKVITNVFIKARYSIEDISEDEKGLMYGFYASIIKYSKKDMGRLKYFVYSYIIGIL